MRVMTSVLDPAFRRHALTGPVRGFARVPSQSHARAGSVAKISRCDELTVSGGQRGWRVNEFKGRHFGGEVVLWAVRWYCRYAVSYRDLESMMTERGVAVDHSTIRWVQRFAPEMERRLRWQWRRPRSTSWRVDETYVKVRGKWAYLYRALDKFGNTIDFYLSATRNTRAAKRFLGKALRGCKEWELPEVVNTDKAPTYAAAIAELKAEGKCPTETRHRQVKYLNNVVEADHGMLKQLIRPVRGFKSMKTAYATIKGFEVMRALRKGQAAMFSIQGADRRTCVRCRPVRAHRGHGMATGSSGQRRCVSRPRFCLATSRRRRVCNRAAFGLFHPHYDVNRD